MFKVEIPFFEYQRRTLSVRPTSVRQTSVKQIILNDRKTTSTSFLSVTKEEYTIQCKSEPNDEDYM